MVAANNVLFPALDRILRQDARFAWMYVVVARRPGPG
jgi:hypothetical protein